MESKTYRESLVARLMSYVTNKRPTLNKYVEFLIANRSEELIELSESGSNRDLADLLFNSFVNEFSDLISKSTTQSNIRLEMTRIEYSQLTTEMLESIFNEVFLKIPILIHQYMRKVFREIFLNLIRHEITETDQEERMRLSQSKSHLCLDNEDYIELDFSLDEFSLTQGLQQSLDH